MTGTPVTIELVALIVGVITVLAGAGLIAARMIRGAINALRVDLDEKLKALTGKLDTLAGDHANHKLHVAENYMSKQSANIVFDKLSAQIDAVGAKTETRLTRIEDKVDRLPH